MHEDGLGLPVIGALQLFRSRRAKVGETDVANTKLTRLVNDRCPEGAEMVKAFLNFYGVFPSDNAR